MRESGIFCASPSFQEYYVKFIGHFVSVYERKAPPFAREAARWSSDAANTLQYVENGRKMPDIMNLSHQQHLKQLPEEESMSADDWPYC